MGVAAFCWQRCPSTTLKSDPFLDIPQSLNRKPNKIAE